MALERTDLIHAIALINPIVGVINQSGLASFTRLESGRYALVCDEPIAAAEGQALAFPGLNDLSICRAQISNANNGLVEVECRDALGILIDPAILCVVITQIATGPGTAIPVAPSLTASRSLYVDAVTGDDDNPGTPALPLRTLIRAGELAPTVIGSPFVEIVLLTNDIYTADNRTFRQRSYPGDGTTPGCLYVRGTTYTDVIASTASLAGTDATRAVSAALVVDALVGGTIEWLDGPAVGERCQIIANTVTDIIPACEFSPAPVPGNLFRVIQPTARINVAGLNIYGAAVEQASETSSYVGGLVFDSVELTGPGVAITYGRITYYTTRDDGTVVLLPGATPSDALAGYDNDLNVSARAPAIVLGVADSAYLGSGYTSGNAIGLSFALSGYLVARASGAIRGAYRMFGGRLYGGNAGSPLLYVGGDASWDVGPGSARRIQPRLTHPTGTLAAVHADADGFCTLINALIECGGAGGNGLYSTRGATIVQGAVADVSGTATVYGSRARFGGRIYTLDDGAGIVGGTARMAAGETPDTTAALGAVGDALIDTTVNDTSVIQRTA